MSLEYIVAKPNFGISSYLILERKKDISKTAGNIILIRFMQCIKLDFTNIVSFILYFFYLLA